MALETLFSLLMKGTESFSWLEFLFLEWLWSFEVTVSCNILQNGG